MSEKYEREVTTFRSPEKEPKRTRGTLEGQRPEPRPQGEREADSYPRSTFEA
jgi:hypothetical protein